MFNINVSYKTRKYLQDSLLQKIFSVRVCVLMVPRGGEESELAEGEAAGGHAADFEKVPAGISVTVRRPAITFAKEFEHGREVFEWRRVSGSI